MLNHFLIRFLCRIIVSISEKWGNPRTVSFVLHLCYMIKRIYPGCFQWKFFGWVFPSLPPPPPPRFFLPFFLFFLTFFRILVGRCEKNLRGIFGKKFLPFGSLRKKGKKKGKKKRKGRKKTGGGKKKSTVYTPEELNSLCSKKIYISGRSKR